MGGWSVLLIGGASGTGKTTTAKAIARELGISWVQVDDLRLAMQWSDVRLPSVSASDALYFFLHTPEPWTRPAIDLRDALIATGEAMTNAIAIVTANHVAQNDPVVIEGDGILPGIVEHPEVRELVADGRVRTVFVMPESADELLTSMIARGRGEHLDAASPETHRIAEMNWLFADWLKRGATERRIPVVATQPWSTLARRILSAV